MVSLKELEKEIQSINERNSRVELDKAWETSYVRRILLMFLTFLAIGAYLSVVKVPQPWLNAIVAAFAFMLSTLILSVFKKCWAKKVYKR